MNRRPLRRLADFLGLKRSVAGLLTMVILVGMGERMAERFLPVYLMALGGGALSIGLLNGMDNLLSALYAFPGGYLSDRLGTKRALGLFNLLAIAGYAVVIAVPRWEAVIAGSVLFLSWTAISLPATMDLVSKALPRSKRTMGVSLHSLVRRVPMALGPVLGGLCIDRWGRVEGVRIAFLAAAAMAVLSTVAQHMLIREEEGARRRAEKNPLRLWREMSPDLRNLLASDILIRFCEQIPYAFMAVWCMEVLGTSGTGGTPVSATSFGVLTSVEMATAMLVYIPVAWLADRGGKKPFVLATFVFFTAFPMVLFLSRSFWPLVAAFVVRGLKEFGEPTRKALIMDLAPEGRKAGMFGLYYLVRDIIVSVAAFGGALLWMVSPAVNFMAASAFGLAGTIWFALRGRDLGPAPGRI